MPTKEYLASYASKRDDLFSLFETVFKNPNQLGGILNRISGTSSAASETKATPETKGPEIKSAEIKAPKLGVWDKVVVGTKAVVLAVSNIDNVYDMVVGGSFYKKELGKLAITFGGGYELALRSELKDFESFKNNKKQNKKQEYEKQFVAGKIYLSNDGKQAWLRDLEGELREVKIDPPIKMASFANKRNNEIYIRDVLAAIQYRAKDYVYIYNSDTPLFFIDLLKDPATVSFIQANSENINNLVNKQAKSILSIVLGTIKDAVPKKDEPASVAQEIVKVLEAGGIDTQFILDTVSPLIQPIVKELTANPGRLNEFGHLAEKIISTSDKKEKGKLQKEFLSKVASINFAGTDSIKALSAFFVNAESVGKLTQMITAVAPMLAARLAIPGIDATLIQDSIPIITKTASVFLGETAQLQSVARYFTSATPANAAANAQLVTNLSSLVNTLAAPQSGVVSDLPNYFINNKAKMIAAAKDAVQKRRDKPSKKALPAYINNELIDSVMGAAIDVLPALLPLGIAFSSAVLQKAGSADLLTRFLQSSADKDAAAEAVAGPAVGKPAGLGSEILGALGSKGIINLIDTIKPLIQPVLTTLGKDPALLADLAHQAANMTLMGDQKAKTKAQKDLINRAGGFAFSDAALTTALSSFFANPASIGKLTEITTKVLDVPGVLARLTELGVSKALVLNSLPIATQAARIAFTQPAALQGVTQYFTSDMPPSAAMNTELVGHLSSLVKAFEAPAAGFTTQLSVYVTTNHADMRAAAKKGLQTRRLDPVKAALPPYINDELIDSVIDVGVDVLPALLPLAIKFSSAVLQKPGTADLLTRFLQSSADKDAAAEAVAGPAVGKPAGLGSEILGALGSKGIINLIDTIKPLIQPVLTTLGKDPALLADLAHQAANMTLMGDQKAKAKAQKDLINRAGGFVFSDAALTTALSSFFANSASVGKLTEITSKVLDVPGVLVRLTELGVSKALVLNSLPIATQAARIAFTQPAALQGITQYFTSDMPPSAAMNTELVGHLSSLVNAFEAPAAGFTKQLSAYVTNNHVDMRAAAKKALETRRADPVKGAALPAYINDELIDSVMDVGVELTPTLLPLAMAFSKELLQKEGTADLLNRFRERPIGPPSVLVPQILQALGSKSKDLIDITKPLMKPLVAALGKDPALLADLTHMAVNMSLTTDTKAKASYQKKLLSKAADLVLKDAPLMNSLSTFFANGATVAKLTQTVNTVLEVPGVAAMLTGLGVNKALIVNSLPIATQAASLVLSKPEELQGVVQYFTKETLVTPEDNAQLVTHLSGLVGALQVPEADFVGQLSSYIGDYHPDMRVAAKGFFNKNQAKLPPYINEALIDSAMDLAVEFSPMLLPSVLALSKEILDKEGTADLLTSFMSTSADKKAAKAAAQGDQADAAQAPEPADLTEQVLIALGPQGITDLLTTINPFIQPGLVALQNNPKVFAELGHIDIKRRLAKNNKEKGQHQQELIAKGAAFVLQDAGLMTSFGAFFADPASAPKIQQITGKVLEAPEIKQRLVQAGVPQALGKKLINNGIPLATKLIGTVLSKSDEMQRMGAYLANPALVTPQKNEQMIADLSGVLNTLDGPTGVVPALQEYLNTNRADIAEVVKAAIAKRKADAPDAVPAYVSDALVDSVLNMGMDLSPTLLPFAMKFSKAAIEKEGSVELFSRFMKSRADKQAAKGPKKLPVPGAAVKPPTLAQTILTELGDAGISNLMNTVQPVIASVLTALGTEPNPTAVAGLAHVAAKMSLTDTKTPEGKTENAEHSKDLLSQIARFDLTALSSQAALKSVSDFLSAPASVTNLTKITKGVLDAPALTARLANLGIEKQLILDAVPILGGTAGALVDKTVDLQGLVKYMYPNANEPAMTQAQLLTHVSHIRDGLQQQQSVFTKILPDYLHDNEFFILNVVGKKENLATLRKNLKIPSDFTDDFITRVAGAGIDLSQDLIPFAFKVASSALADSNQGAVLDIMDKAKKAFAPMTPMVKEINGVPLTKKQLKAQAKKRKLEKKTKQKEIRTLVNLVLKLKNTNPELKNLINNEFPAILAQRSELLGGLLDEFTSKTTLGKYVDIRAKAYLDVASRHIPKLIDIAQLYNNKQYTRMILKASTLIFKKGVLSLAGKTMMRALSYKYQAKSQSGFRRRFRAQRSIKKVFIQTLSAVPVAGKRDLGAELANRPRTGNSTLDYSLINKDFRGLHFSFKPEISFKNTILDGFKFNKAKLNSSFEDSQIINCNFEDAIFTKQVSFKNAKIDSESLKTLIPAIDAYNAKHKKHPKKQIAKDYTIILAQEKPVKKQKP